MKRALWIIPALIVCLILGLLLGPKIRISPDPQEDAPDTPQPPPTYGLAEERLPADVVPPDTPPDTRLNRLADGRVEFLPAVNVSRTIHETETPRRPFTRSKSSSANTDSPSARTQSA